jgi:hypothetical protein
MLLAERGVGQVPIELGRKRGGLARRNEGAGRAVVHELVILFMVTDPPTEVSSRRGRMMVVTLVALVEMSSSSAPRR